MPRSARLLGAPLVMPPVLPMNSLATARAFWWLDAQDQDLAKGFAQAAFHAHWGQGRDLSAASAVAEVAETLGIATADLLAGIQDQAIKDRLRQETEESLAKGVFGSPFFIIDGEPFWGADRLDQVERWLSTGGW